MIYVSYLKPDTIAWKYSTQREIRNSNTLSLINWYSWPTQPLHRLDPELSYHQRIENTSIWTSHPSSGHSREGLTVKRAGIEGPSLRVSCTCPGICIFEGSSVCSLFVSMQSTQVLRSQCAGDRLKIYLLMCIESSSSTHSMRMPR